MHIANHAIYCHPLPAGHRFPMLKYDLLPRQLLHEGIVTESAFFEPRNATDAEILLVHHSDYLHSLKTLSLSRQAERKTGFPLSKQLVQREIRIMGGTINCLEHALSDGLTFNIAGGTHHAYAGHGEGFCLLNDIAISIAVALKNKWIKQALVIDLDVHQGNGTAKLFEHRPEAFTFSMHGAKNYPLKKETSNLDLNMPDDCSDDQYLQTLKDHLPQLINNVKPDLIHFQSGVDVLKSDKLGRLALSTNACRLRDELVFQSTFQHGIPIVTTMGGGYSEDIKIIVNAHANTYRVASDIYGI